VPWLWYIYTATPVGQRFLEMPAAQAAGFQYLAQLNLVMVALKVTLTVLIVGLAAGTAGQLLHFIRLFHEPLSFLARSLFWTLPLAGVAGRLIYREDPMISLALAWIIAFVPTLILLNRSFGLVQTLVPEVGTLISPIRHASGGLLPVIDWLNKMKSQMVSYLSARVRQ
jgi:hypothetical protein